MKNSELKIDGKIFGLAPVQAEGTVDRNLFYFWAKRTTWSFAISEHLEFEPVNIQNMDDGIKYGFYKEKEYGVKDSHAASFMDTKKVEKIIIECCQEYNRMKK